MTTRLSSAQALAEITGPYGPVIIAEKVIQRLWARGVFLNREMIAASGRKITVNRTGRFNVQEGPDFRGGTWEVDGRSVSGDIEIHFYREDWRAHGHDRDPEFDDVRLHAVVFPPSRASVPARTRSGHEPETLVLLPYLPEDLETAATEDALMRGEGRPGDDSVVEYLATLSPEERAARMKRAARDRWESKVGFAKQRLATEDAPALAHRLFLETLGLRRNRAPMADLAARHPIGDFATRDPDGFFSAMSGRWKLAGVRPSNHPRTRLRAYARLAQTNPGWPAAAAACIAGLDTAGMPADTDTSSFRKSAGLNAIRKALAADVFGGALGGTRLDTLVTDALLPWATATTGRDHFASWLHWPMGDAPENIAASLTTLRLTGPGKPISNGLFQGLLGIALGL